MLLLLCCQCHLACVIRSRVVRHTIVESEKERTEKSSFDNTALVIWVHVCLALKATHNTCPLLVKTHTHTHKLTEPDTVFVPSRSEKNFVLVKWNRKWACEQRASEHLWALAKHNVPLSFLMTVCTFNGKQDGAVDDSNSSSRKHRCAQMWASWEEKRAKEGPKRISFHFWGLLMKAVKAFRVWPL